MNEDAEVRSDAIGKDNWKKTAPRIRLREPAVWSWVINKKLFEHLCEFFLLRSKNLVGAEESAELDFFGSFFGDGKKNNFRSGK